MTMGSANYLPRRLSHRFPPRHQNIHSVDCHVGRCWYSRRGRGDRSSNITMRPGANKTKMEANETQQSDGKLLRMWPSRSHLIRWRMGGSPVEYCRGRSGPVTRIRGIVSLLLSERAFIENILV